MTCVNHGDDFVCARIDFLRRLGQLCVGDGLAIM
jgi:hypothetical protein